MCTRYSSVFFFFTYLKKKPNALWQYPRGVDFNFNFDFDFDFAAAGCGTWMQSADTAGVSHVCALSVPRSGHVLCCFTTNKQQECQMLIICYNPLSIESHFNTNCNDLK